jgi:hypothetical protein
MKTLEGVEQLVKVDFGLLFAETGLASLFQVLVHTALVAVLHNYVKVVFRFHHFDQLHDVFVPQHPHHSHLPFEQFFTFFAG